MPEEEEDIEMGMEPPILVPRLWLIGGGDVNGGDGDGGIGVRDCARCVDGGSEDAEM